jgi:lyso-ornithine lipid O-acyltransferase
MGSRLSGKTDRVHPRAILRVVLIALGLAVLILPHLIVRRFTYFSPFSRLFLRYAAWAVGVDIHLKGGDQRLLRSVLYIANHVSWLDIFILSGRTGCAFVAKADMAPWPVIGWLATLNNSVYVQRENRLDVGAQRDAIQAALRWTDAFALPVFACRLCCPTTRGNIDPASRD